MHNNFVCLTFWMNYFDTANYQAVCYFNNIMVIAGIIVSGCLNFKIEKFIVIFDNSKGCYNNNTLFLANLTNASFVKLAAKCNNVVLLK